MHRESILSEQNRPVQHNDFTLIQELVCTLQRFFVVGKLHSKCNVQCHHVMKLSDQILVFHCLLPFHVALAKLDVATLPKNAVYRQVLLCSSTSQQYLIAVVPQFCMHRYDDASLVTSASNSTLTWGPLAISPSWSQVNS